VAFISTSPASVRAANGNIVKKRFYFDIKRALQEPSRLNKPIVTVAESGILRSKILRRVKLGLSTTEKEC